MANDDEILAIDVSDTEEVSDNEQEGAVANVPEDVMSRAYCESEIEDFIYKRNQALFLATTALERMETMFEKLDNSSNQIEALHECRFLEPDYAEKYSPDEKRAEHFSEHKLTSLL